MSKHITECVVAGVDMEVRFDLDIPDPEEPAWFGITVEVDSVWHHGTDLLMVLNEETITDIEDQILDQHNDKELEN